MKHEEETSPLVGTAVGPIGLPNETRDSRGATTMEISQFLLEDPKASDAGTAEASNSSGIEASGIGKKLGVSSLEKNHETYDFGPNKGTFLAELSLMLELFDEGKTAEDIRILFYDKNRPFSLSFIQTVVNGDIPPSAQDERSDAEQLKAERQMHLAMTMFAQILRLNRKGRSVQFIQDKFEHHQCYSRANFIEELIFYEKNWDLGTLPD